MTCNGKKETQYDGLQLSARDKQDCMSVSVCSRMGTLSRLRFMQTLTIRGTIGRG